MAKISNNLGADELLAGQSILSKPAEEFENDPRFEALWAMKAFEHSRIHFNILCSVDPKLLRLTPHDEQIYTKFRQEFPEMKIDVLNEEQIKSEGGKKKWREFCDSYKEIVDDFNFCTLIRIDATGEYSPENTFLVPRIQFFAIETARNREGFNDIIRTKFKNHKPDM